MSSSRKPWSLYGAIALCLLCSLPAGAITVPKEEPPIPEKLRQAMEKLDRERYDVRPEPRKTDPGDAAAVRGWKGFQIRTKDQRWRVEVDERTGAPLVVEGSGIPWVPGRGNDLGAGAGLAAQAGSRAQVAAAAGAFIQQNRELLGVGPENLVLDEQKSKGFGRANRYWTLHYQSVLPAGQLGPIPMRESFVFFRVSQGNLVQFGNHLAVVPQGIDTSGLIPREQAVERARDLLGSPSDFRVTEGAPDLGQADRTLLIVPFNGPGATLRHQLVRSLFVGGAGLSLELWFDAHTGELVHAMNRKVFVDGTVKGGIYPVTNTDPEVLRGLPFLTVNNGAPKTTNAAGAYDYAPAGSLASAGLSGSFVDIVDVCGDSALSTSITPGNLSFGIGAGTDCDTPGFGDAGNTHAARSTYYHLNLIQQKARQYLNDPVETTPWLNDTLTANVNIALTCNANWDPDTGEVNFYRSGGGCSNTGEIAAVFLHEFGHGLDQMTNGTPPEYGSGEAYGDTMAFLQTHDSCIGDNFQPGVPCMFGCDASCTGVRDVAVAPEVSPANIELAPADCDGIFACPYFWGPWPYQGPMGYQGHCESLIASGAVWDMIQGFVGRYGPGAGWALGDRIWYESLYSTGSAYQVVAGGQCNPAATVDGCGGTNWYTVFLALDDDNGDLADGTPNADIIWDAFNAHGIACGDSAPPVSSSCPALAAPAGLSATPDTGQISLSWGAVAGATSYKVFRNSFGCDQGFTPIATVADPATDFIDTPVENGTPYFYAVQAVGADDVCVSQFSTCQTATATAPLQPANIFMVLDESGSMAGSTEAAGEQKIDALEDAAAMVVDLVKDYAADGFRLGAVSFSAAVTGTENLKDLSVPVEETALDGFITDLDPTATTAIGQGINGALSAFPVSPNRKVLLLMSDGIQNVAPMLELQAPPPGAAVGGTDLPDDVRFYTVALGSSIQEDLFDDLANQGGIPGFYYSGGTAEIQANFAFWIADVLGLGAGGGFAPDGLTPDGLTASAAAEPAGSSTFVVNATVRRVTFLVTWPAKGRDLRFHLDTPAGRIDPPAGSFHPNEGYASYTVKLPLQGHGSQDHVGDWVLVVEENEIPIPAIAAPSATASPAFQAYALYDDPALDLSFTAGGPDPGAGEDIPVEARVVENGAPLSGQTVFVAVAGPGEGLGEILASTQVTPEQLASAPASAGDPLASDAEKKMAVLRAEHPELFQTLPPGVIPLTEASPGIYRGTIPAARTGPAGTYVLAFTLDGKGIVNDRFRRSQLFSRYLRLKPTPSETLVSQAAREEDSQLIRILVTPRDRSRKRLGPGWGDHLKAVADVGTFVGTPQDLLDGSYALTLDAPAASDPKVRIEVRGEPVVDRKVSEIPGGSTGFEGSVFLGWFFFGGALPVEDGPVLGQRVAYALGNHLSLEAEVGATWTEDETGDEGLVVQLGANAVYHLFGPGSPVRPFLTGGIGGLFFTGFPADDDCFVFNAGLGIKGGSGSVRWRIDARDYLADDAYGTGTTHNLQLGLGLVVDLP